MKRKQTSKSGSAVIATTLMALLASGLTGAYLDYTINDVHLARRALDYQQAKILADSGLDYSLTQIRNHLNAFRFTLSQGEMQSLMDQIDAPPNMTESFQNPTVDYIYEPLVRGEAWEKWLVTLFPWLSVTV